MHSLTGVPRRPVVLVILDGFGVNPSRLNNGVAEADTPNLDAYFSRYPHTTLNASGHAVGLPDGQMGNSEVGHLTLGAGEVIRQDIVKISDAIESGAFFNNAALLNAIDKANSMKRPVHLVGLVSDGGVHSSMDHLKAIIQLCKKRGNGPLLHAITDGRDTPPRSMMHYLPEIESQLHESGGAVASITGRYFAMDRDKRWERTEKAWRAYVHGKAHEATSAETAIHSAYAAGDTDEFIQPIRLPSFTSIINGDQVIFFNFRKDRPRQLVAALGDAAFKGFDRGDAPLAEVTCMMPYDRNLKLPYAFEPEKPATTLGQIISVLGLAQFHCAETEKYAHVTYFFNGGRQTPYAGETQILIPSPRVATYDQKPSMNAKEVADAVVGAISKGRYSFIVVNFANGDMVGHTAKRHAVIEAVETLDREASRVLEAAENAGYSVILTADHGNCEEMVDPYTGEPHTQHTTYPVPCMIMDEENWQLSSSGGLSNVAPTVLQLMGFTPAAEMQPSLLLRKLPGKRLTERHDPKRLRVA
ncbi:MAG: 2,3-bisphosphoglycerate-independent phosphoglycerate mutase [Gammaproteobacteria bacterium]|nr:2,3-bisphosphoglycerate-independent phosphoglycerate mutase [Gammaproteobacteria bacterium]